MASKEELAGKLRKLLGVDVRFEKLSKDELVQLMEAVEKLFEVEEEEGEGGPLGFGVIPAVREQILRKVLPELRAEVRRVVDEAILGFRAKGKKGPRKAKKG